MTVDVPKLSKTLNDQTRIRILKILKQKGQMSYGGLLTDLEITNTGRLNYHLKVLGDLVSKDGSSGAYSLSEKSIVAIDFLNKFQTLTSGITTPIKVPPIPYESTARTLRALVGLEVAAIFLIGVYAYVSLPSQVALHYSFNGQLYTSAPREIFLALAAVLNIPQAVFLLVSRARYALVNKYPYSLKVPRFAANLSQLDYERRGCWINRLFAAVLAVAATVGLTMIYLMTSIYESALSATALPTYSVELTIVITGVAVLALICYLRTYVRQMNTEAKK